LTTANGLTRFLALAAQLKRVRRQGWLDRGVFDPESAADHSWAVALLAWLAAAGRDDLDRDRVLLLGLVHDLPEAVAGDATPFDHLRDPDGVVPPERFVDAPTYSAVLRREKQLRERAALDAMTDGLTPDLAAELREAWEEYEAGETVEARFVRQVDKLETLLQATLYQAEQPELVIESFRRGAHRDITDPLLRELLDELDTPDPPSSHR
jgi:putative hydrolase of HD superfamily